MMFSCITNDELNNSTQYQQQNIAFQTIGNNVSDFNQLLQNIKRPSRFGPDIPLVGGAIHLVEKRPSSHNVPKLQV